MTYTKKILFESKYNKITYYANKEVSNNKCVITFGEVDSTLEEIGFGSKLVLDEGFDHIYVAQKKGTQYQFLSSDTFKEAVNKVLNGKNIYTYGSSLGAYCAIYYGGIINANILAMSPRIPVHPAIDKLMNIRFKNQGFHHDDLEAEKKTSGRVAVFYDKNNYIDNYYIEVFLNTSYPNAEYYHIKNGGHYTARALLLSGELKNIALNFFYDKNLIFSLNQEKILNWHLKKLKARIRKNKLGHAHENLDVLLHSRIANDDDVRQLVKKYKEKLVKKYKSK